MTDVKISLDRSKPYGECRGERTPEDPHYRVHFWQGGKMNQNGKIIHVNLPFDAHGDLIPDDGNGNAISSMLDGKPIVYQPLYTAEMRAYLEAKKQRAASSAASAPAQTLVEDEAEDEVVDKDDEVNLVAWLKGDAKYQPHVLRAAAKKRYHKNYPNISELVVDLVLDEKLIPEEELHKSLAKYLPAKTAA